MLTTSLLILAGCNKLSRDSLLDGMSYSSTPSSLIREAGKPYAITTISDFANSIPTTPLSPDRRHYFRDTLQLLGEPTAVDAERLTLRDFVMFDLWRSSLTDRQIDRLRSKGYDWEWFESNELTDKSTYVQLNRTPWDSQTNVHLYVYEGDTLLRYYHTVHGRIDESGTLVFTISRSRKRDRSERH